MVHGCMVYTRYKKLFTHVEPHASAVSLLESGEGRCIKAINNNNTRIMSILIIIIMDSSYRRIQKKKKKNAVQKCNALHARNYRHLDIHTTYAHRNGLRRFVKRPG